MGWRFFPRLVFQAPVFFSWKLSFRFWVESQPSGFFLVSIFRVRSPSLREFTLRAVTLERRRRRLPAGPRRFLDLAPSDFHGARFFLFFFYYRARLKIAGCRAHFVCKYNRQFRVSLLYIAVP